MRHVGRRAKGDSTSKNESKRKNNIFSYSKLSLKIHRVDLKLANSRRDGKEQLTRSFILNAMINKKNVK